MKESKIMEVCESRLIGISLDSRVMSILKRRARECLMLSKLAKLSLVSTSLAPIFLTLWFIGFSSNWKWKEGLSFFVLALALIIICCCLLKLSKQRLEKIPVEIHSIKTADREMAGFVLVYLLPLIDRSALDIDCFVLVFVAIMFFVIVLVTNYYHFNPLLGFLVYDFYEVTVKGEITYVLITKKNLTNCKAVRSVVQVSEYMILEA